MTDVDERTEQARSLQTKAKLLAATLSTIHDVGSVSYTHLTLPTSDLV